MVKHAQITQLCLIRRECWSRFLHADIPDNFLQINTMIFDMDGQVFSKFPKWQVCNIFTISQKKKVWDEVDFLYADKHQDFVQVDFNILGIKVSYKVIISLLLGLIKLSQSTQSNKLAIPLQYLKEWTCSFADKHQSSYKLALFFLMEVVRLVESAQNRMLVIILQYLKKKLSLLLLFKWL